MGGAKKSTYEKGVLATTLPVVRDSSGWEHDCDNKRPLSNMMEEHVPLSVL